MKYPTRALVFLGLALCAGMVFGQGLTTGVLSGVVTDADNAVLPGVSVEAVHPDTGTRYSGQTGADGRFSFQNVRPGPYIVTVALEGFHPQEATDPVVSLGEATVLSFRLELETVTETVTVVGESNPLITPSRTGNSSNISTGQIENLPNIDRGFNDFARLNPFMVPSAENEDPDAISVAGRSTRFNNIQIDGAVNNDLFGLADSGTPGGQTETPPISMDAVAEMKLVVADYDVRNGGFTGGSINAITRNGTNRFKGSVFYYSLDESLVGEGKEELGEPGVFDEEQYGFRIGGPIVKDKIFFFANGEIGKRNTATGWSLDGSSGQCFGNCDPFVQAQAARFKSILQSQYGFDPGPFNELVRPTDSDRWFLRFDFNAGTRHQITARWNYVDAVNLINRPGSRTYEWDSEAYDINNKTNSLVAAVNSTFGSNKFNEFRMTYQTVEDRRPPVSTFPWIEVEDLDRAQGYFEEFEAGSEPFSVRNALDQNVIELTDNFTWLMGNHTLTFGTHNEFFNFDNLFIQNAYGSYEFADMDAFEAGIAKRYRWTFVNDGQSESQKFDVNQWGFYGGDQWAVKSNLTLTYGLRVDIPFFPDEPSFNQFTVDTYGVATNNMPDGEQLWQPRFGFNWDIGNDGQQQLRGGLGVFAGRTPYVWISNQYARTGIEQTFVEATGAIGFNPDPFGQPPEDAVGSASFGEFNLIDPNFKFPQVMRYNLAYDRQLPWWDMVGTAELIYTDSIDEIDYKDLNITETGETIPFDGRPMFTRVDSDVSGAYYITNTDRGDSTNLALKLEKPYRGGLWGFVSYAYGDSNVVNDGTSSRAVSNFQYNEQLNPNDAQEARSDFSVEHRFNFSVAYRFNDNGRWPTTVSAFYNLQSGRPYTYIYGSQNYRSINQDGYYSNDLLYVPAGPDDVVLENGTWAELDAFISSEECLNSKRGGIVDRNDCDAPWFHTLDIHLAQDIPIKNTNLQVTFDILNFVNLLDSEAGSNSYANFNTLSPISYEGITDDGKPIYGLSRVITDPSNNNKYDFHSLHSRWRMKWGIRWTF
ncbi:MAG: hypothetical protein GWP16_00645 [Nitrospirae bacterium]|nr:hypothetical protein [Nitrospirota bacterium]